jgi:hypothetical protein
MVVGNDDARYSAGAGDGMTDSAAQTPCSSNSNASGTTLGWSSYLTAGNRRNGCDRVGELIVDH